MKYARLLFIIIDESGFYTVTRVKLATVSSGNMNLCSQHWFSLSTIEVNSIEGPADRALNTCQCVLVYDFCVHSGYIKFSTKESCQ